MSAISSFAQPLKSLESPGKGEQAWLSGLLRRAANQDSGRLGIVSTLAVADLWRIWRGTARRGTARDRRTNEIIGLELERRGLLDETRQPRRAAPNAAIDGD